MTPTNALVAIKPLLGCHEFGFTFLAFTIVISLSALVGTKKELEKRSFYKTCLNPFKCAPQLKQRIVKSNCFYLSKYVRMLNTNYTNICK